MKTISIFLAYFLFLIPHSFSQAPGIEWQNTIGGTATDELWSMEPTTDGGYILGGTSSSHISGDKTENTIGSWDYWVVKINAAGNIEWQETLGGTDQDHLRVVQQTADGGYIVGGYSQSNPSADKSEDNLSYDYWVIKLDSDGDIEWDNTIGGAGVEYLHTIEQTTDGGYLVGGYSTSNISGDKTENALGGGGYGDYWIVKLDNTGMVEWDETIGGSNDEELYSIDQTIDGGFILCGTSSSDASFDKSENTLGDSFEDDYWIVKIDAEANVEWDITIGGLGWDYAIAIRQTADNGYIVGGQSSSNASPFKSEDRIDDALTSFDVWIVKLDESGEIEWDNTIGGIGQDYFNAFDLCADGGYIIGVESESIISADKTENPIGLTDFWLVKLDHNGVVLWDNTIGGNSYDQLHSVYSTSDGGYIAAGSSRSIISGDKTENTVGGGPYYDYWVVKTESDFICTPPTGIFADNITTSSAKIHWDAVPGGTKYQIWYRPITGGSWLKKNAVTTVKTLNSLLPNTTYKYKIKTVCDAEPSAFSEVLNFTTLPFKEDRGIDDELKITVYPNPNNGIFNVEFILMQTENVELSLINLLGEEIISAHLESVSGNIIQTVNIQNQNPGIYFLIIKSESLNCVIKVAMSAD